jgi:hypothetical protein
MWMLPATLTISGLPFGGSVRADTPIEELIQVEVTSAAARAQARSKTPAAVFVVGLEGLGRGGAFSVAEVLRLAPGLQEARTISARGLNGGFSNKMLIDGRSVYPTRLRGVSWNGIAHTLQTKIDNAQGGATLSEGTFRACYTPKALDKVDVDVSRGPSAARLSWRMGAERTVYFRGPEHYGVRRGGFVTLRWELQWV